jgi:hypothetical protein
LVWPKSLQQNTVLTTYICYRITSLAAALGLLYQIVLF